MPQNEPAFPVSEEAMIRNLQGMSIRDYFAAKAMQAQLSGFWSLETFHGWSRNEIAQEAYNMADAMLKARQLTKD